MRYLSGSLTAVTLLAVSLGVPAMAQHVISAKSGVIHYTEGIVKLDDKVAERKAAEFPAMKIGQTLTTEMGRAEILLSPGVFLRVAENSGVRMVRNDLADTELAMTAGSLLLEVGELEKHQALSLTVGDARLEFTKRGLFRVNFSPADVLVHDGSVLVASGGQSVTVREGRIASLNSSVIVPVKFNKEDTDAFYRWAMRRSGYIATANMAAAKRIYDRGYAFNGSGWVFDPMMGLYTFVPMNGMYRSPWGFSFYSPRAIGSAWYAPAPSLNAGHGGYGGLSGGMSAGRTGGMYNGASSGSGVGVVSAAGHVTAAPAAAPSAPAASVSVSGGGGGRGAQGDARGGAGR